MKIIKLLMCTSMCLSLPALATDFSAIEKIVNETKAAAMLPSGTSIAVVKDNKVIYRGNFGYADIASKQPVTSDTSYYIASITKPYFALSMLLKEHQGQISESTNMATLFPEMSFPKFDASKVTVKHLLSHTMGIDNSPLATATAHTGLHDEPTRNKLVSVSYPNKKAPLNTFQYSNVGYNILSVWSDNVHQKSWQQLLEQTVLVPLKTTQSSTTFSTIKDKGWQLPNYYSILNGADNPVYLQKNDSTMHAAGGMISSTNDITNFIKIQLNNGKLDGQQIFPAKVITKSQQAIATSGFSYENFKREQYAWGWHIGPYLGETLYHHFGGYAGMHSHLSFMPEKGIGIVILNNDDLLASKLTNVVAHTIYATLLEDKTELAKANSKAIKLKKDAAKLPIMIKQHEEELAARQWQLSLPKQSYVGTYHHPHFGNIVVTLTKDEQFYLEFGQLRSVATAHKSLDGMRVRFLPHHAQVVRIIVDSNNIIQSIKYDGEVFKRIQ